MIEDLQGELSRLANQLSGRRRDTTEAERREVRTPSTLWLAVITLCAAAGVALCAAGDALSRSTRSSSQFLFWAGLLAIVAPIIVRLLSPRAARSERIWLVVVLGLALYLVKVVRSPFGLDTMDELAHVSNTQSILRTHELFGSNPILPVTAHYPGLESLDAAFASMTGLSPYGAGLVVIGVARVVVMLALFLLYEQLSRSARIAALATAIYTANSSFLLFDAQVSYESLALSLLVLILFAIAEWRRAGDRLGWSVVIVLAIFAVVATHHLTSYALLVILFALCAVQVVLERRGASPEESAGLSTERRNLVCRYMAEDGTGAAPPVDPPLERKVVQQRSSVIEGSAPWAFLLVGTAATLAWLVFVAGSTVGYLSPVFTKAFLSTIHTFTAESGPRTPFTASQGYHAPLIERAVGLGSYALIAVGIPFGLRALQRRYGRNPFVLVLGLLSIAFYAVAALRLAPGAWETAERATEFLFLGLGFVLALAVTRLEQWSPRQAPWLGRAALVSLICLIFVGGVISGTQGNLRLSQPYRVQAGPQAIEPPGREMARWAAVTLPPGSRYAASDTDARFLAAYAEGNPVTGKVWAVDSILRSPVLASWQRRNLSRAHVKYVVVDRNAATFGALGFYFMRQPLRESDLLPRGTALKFKRWGADRLYDNGPINVYRWTGGAHASRKR